MILANRNFAFNCGSVAVFMICCGLCKEPCTAINEQDNKSKTAGKDQARRLERPSKTAGKIKQEGWKDQARRPEKIKQEGWKRLSKKAGKDQTRRYKLPVGGINLVHT